jgi:hypothetical protein
MHAGDVTATYPPSSYGDFKVSWMDLFTLAGAYNSRPDDPNWNPNCDINSDGHVGWEDLFILAANYGTQV